MLEGSCHCGTLGWRFDGQPAGGNAYGATALRRAVSLRARRQWHPSHPPHPCLQTRQGHSDDFYPLDDLIRDGRCVN